MIGVPFGTGQNSVAEAGGAYKWDKSASKKGDRKPQVFRRKEHTLEECGVTFRVTRERIRQIEEKALRRLRMPSRANKLREYAEM
jgi:hypothetical protein